MITTPFPLPIMLDAADRKALRARAHHLDPVVMVGDAGLTRAVVEETDRALRAHELIKIRVLGDDRDQRRSFADELCSVLGCASVQSIGKLLVLYRPRPIEEPAGGHTPKKRVAQKQGVTPKQGVAPKPGAARKRTVSPKPGTARKQAVTAQRAGSPATARKRTTRSTAAAAPAPARATRAARGKTTNR